MYIDTHLEESNFSGSLLIFGKTFNFDGDVIEHCEQEHYCDGDRGIHTENLIYKEVLITNLVSDSGQSIDDPAINELVSQDVKDQTWF